MPTLNHARSMRERVSLPSTLSTFSLLIAVLFWPGPNAHAQQVTAFRMSGAELLEGLRGETPVGEPDTERSRQLSYDRAAAYVAGVADATDGSRWCLRGGIKLHELTDRVASQLITLPPEALSQNAAIPVLEALARSFPCSQR